MPDQDTVQVQMPDGRILTGPRKNLPIAIQMGGKIYDPSSQKPPQVGAISRAASGAWDSVKEMVPHDLASLKSAVENPPSSGGAIVNMAQSMAQKMLEAKQSGGGAGEIVATGAGTAIGLPVDTIRSKAASGDVAGTVGSAIPPVILAMLGLTEKGRTVVRDTVSATSKPIMREFMGVADKDVQPAIKESQAKATAAQVKYHEDMADATKKYLDDLKKVDEDNKLGTDKHTAAMSKARQDHETEVAKIEKSNADAQKAHTDKIEEIKSKTAAKIADQKAKQIESSRAQTASQTKQSALATKKGPVYQRITDMADEAQANVREVDKKVRALENARWNAFEKEIDHPVVDWEPVQKAVVDAEDNILQGSPENVAIFRSIMKEGDGPGGLSDASVFRGSGGVDVKEFLSSLQDPVKRQQVIRDMQARGEDVGGGGPMPKEGATVPFKTARGFATEFNEKIYGRDLPSDVRRALRFVQDENDKQLVKAMARLHADVLRQGLSDS